jgi:sortase A
MAPHLATALVVLTIAALGVYGPIARSTRRGAHLAPPERAVPADATGRLAVWLRKRPAARMLLSAASLGLLVTAVAVIGYPFYTNLVQDRLQGRLDHQLASPELREAYLERRVGEGDSLTQILIPDIGVDVIVVEGTSDTALRAGAGHYPETPLPCEIGNVAIAGHRTTWGRPFHNLDLLRPGAEITLRTPIGSCTYEVDAAPFVVQPKDVSVVANTPDEARLTLTTCHPKGSARERLIATATLVSSEVTA